MNAVSLFCLLIFSLPAFAYVEPGTGSMLLQGLLAGAAGLVVVLKIYWYRIKGFFSGGTQTEIPAESEAPKKSEPDSEDSAA